MLLCMRTTIDLNDELLRAAKRRAADEGVPLRRIVEHALRRHLEGAASSKNYQLSWHPERGRLQPGVQLNDRDALFQVMDDRQ